jgi:hypothetical protein
MTNHPQPKVWITYAWADNAKGYFAYLVHELKSVGVEVTYDVIACSHL